MDVLEAEILAGDIGPGERLSEEALAKRFGVSRTPVREALQNIVSRALADRVPYKGVVVRAFDDLRIHGMFEALAEIEALCGGLAAERRHPQDIEALREVQSGMSKHVDVNAWLHYDGLNMEFHGLIYRLSGNEDLCRIATDMRLKLAPFSRSQLLRPDRLADSNREHGLIVELLASGNRPGVEQALRNHLRQAEAAFFGPRAGPPAP